MGACARNMQSDPTEIKPAQCCIKLVFHLSYTMMHGSTKLKLYLTFRFSYLTSEQHGSSFYFLRQRTVFVSNLVIFQDLLIVTFEHPLECLSFLQSFHVKRHIFNVFIITEFLLSSFSATNIYLKDFKMLFFYYSCRIAT